MLKGEQLQEKKLNIATGLKEVCPEIKGLCHFQGKSLFNCPYCDGWEMRDRPLLLLAEDATIFHMAKQLYNWSKDLIVYSNGKPLLSDQKKVLESKRMEIIETPVIAFEGRDGLLEQVVFADGRRIQRSGGFIIPKWLPKVDFSRQLGYAVTENGVIVTDTMGRSVIACLYAAGDAAYEEFA